jgi:hypothetical protein
MNLQRHNKRKKRGQSGAVLTEGLIAISLLVVLFAGTTFFHRMYVAKTDTMQRARLQAWAGTRFKCPGGDVPGTAKVTVQVPNPLLAANPGGAAQRNIQSHAKLVCNLEPENNEDMISVLGWALGEGTQSISTDAFGAVGSMVLSAVGEALNPFNWFF